MKKLIPVLLSLFMVLALTGGTALAETVYTESALNYTITDESITMGRMKRLPYRHPLPVFP